MFILAEEFRAEWLWSGEESSLAVYGLDWSWADMTRAGDENKRNIRQHERSGDGHRTDQRSWTADLGQSLYSAVGRCTPDLVPSSDFAFFDSALANNSSSLSLIFFFLSQYDDYGALRRARTHKIHQSESVDQVSADLNDSPEI